MTPPPPDTALHTALDTEEWQRFFAAVMSLLEAEAELPVRPPRPPGELVEALELELPAEGRPLPEVIDALVALGRASPATATARFFNQLFAGRLEAATMADMLAALLNNSMYTYKVAGPQVIVEQLLVRRMAALAGFEQGEGAFTPGGSLSNFLAMVLARGERFPETRAEGLSGRRATVYTSQLSHYSIRKGAVLAGIGRDRVRMIATDARGRMCADDLRAWLTRDREEGLEPLFVNLTAGTTVLGAFDPLPELIEVAREHGLWVHVDGALGGSMLLSPRHRHLLAGLEQADSFTWDAHKTMGVPLTCSVCLVRERGVLMRHLADQADYLFQDDCELDRGLTSLQCGRRNDALKLWAAWQHLGDAGFAARVEAVVDRAAYAARCVEASPGLRLVRPPESVNVCFTVEGVDAPSLCQALHERGRAMVGYAKVDGHEVVRLACASADLREADLDQFFEDVLQTAAELRAM